MHVHRGGVLKGAAAAAVASMAMAAPAVQASFPGRNGALVATAEARCKGDSFRYLRRFGQDGRDRGPLTRRCVVVGSDEDGPVIRESFAPVWSPAGDRLLFAQAERETIS